MARPVKVRVSYAGDAGFFARLVEAVSKDPRQSPAWREEVSEHLRALVTLFLDAKQGPIPSPKGDGKVAPARAAAR
jgi:hypothetical protein